MKKSCCTKETCSRNRNKDKSSDISDSPRNDGTANKGTQMTPNISSMSTEKTSMMPSSEYEVFYDCLKEKHTHPKLDMNQVYQSMENPELFHGSLRQVTLLTQQLLKYFEQPPTLAPSKCKLLKNEQNFQNKNNHSCSRELVPWKKSSEQKCDDCQAIKNYNGPLKSSSGESVQMQIPLEDHLQSLYDKFKPRDFSKCTNPLCTDIAKAAETYMKVAGIEPAPNKETPIKESSSKYYSCISTDEKYSQTIPAPLFDVGFMPPCWCTFSNTHTLELLNKCPSTNYQKTCVPLKDENHMPPCWCSMKNANAELKPELLCECGVKPDKCICDKPKEVKSPKKVEITSSPPASALLSQKSDEDPNLEPGSCGHEVLAGEPPATAAILQNSEEDSNLEPCSCGHEELEGEPAKEPPPSFSPLQSLPPFAREPAKEPAKKPPPSVGQKPMNCEEDMKCACDLKKPLTPPKPPRKIYRMVFPQHKDLDICVKCRFEPSPLIDEAGNVFCPGNCGCCLCPWKTRASNSLEDALRHSKIKVCKCRDRCTIFTGVNKVDSACSQSSYFDVCPCREKAEEKHIELFGTDMSKNIRQGDEVLLRDVKELMPAKKGSKRFLTSPLYNEVERK